MSGINYDLLLADFGARLQDYGLDLSGLGTCQLSMLKYFLECEGLLDEPQVIRVRMNALLVKHHIREGLLAWANANPLGEQSMLVQKVLQEPTRFHKSKVRALMTVLDKQLMGVLTSNLRIATKGVDIDDLCLQLARSYTTQHYEAIYEGEQLATYLFALNELMVKAPPTNRILQWVDEEELNNGLYEEVLSLRAHWSSDGQQGVISLGLIYLDIILMMAKQPKIVPKIYHSIALLVKTIQSTRDTSMFEEFHQLSIVKALLTKHPQFMQDVFNEFVSNNLTLPLQFIRDRISTFSMSLGLHPRDAIKRMLQFGIDGPENDEDLVFMTQVLRKHHAKCNLTQMTAFKEIVQRVIKNKGQLKEINKSMEDRIHLIRNWSFESRQLLVNRYDGGTLCVGLSNPFEYHLRIQNNTLLVKSFNEGLTLV